MRHARPSRLPPGSSLLRPLAHWRAWYHSLWTEHGDIVLRLQAGRYERRLRFRGAFAAPAVQQRGITAALIDRLIGARAAKT